MAVRIVQSLASDNLLNATSVLLNSSATQLIARNPMSTCSWKLAADFQPSLLVSTGLSRFGAMFDKQQCRLLFLDHAGERVLQWSTDNPAGATGAVQNAVELTLHPNGFDVLPAQQPTYGALCAPARRAS